MENDKGNGLNVHILELILNERALKIHYIILHNLYQAFEKSKKCLKDCDL